MGRNARDIHPASGMVERAARAVCALQGLEADASATGRDPPVANWRTIVPLVEAVLRATALPVLPVLEGLSPESHPELSDWRRYRASLGLAGARAREPTLRAFTGWHVTAAWRTWNGMVEAALEHSARLEPPPEV